MSDSNQATHDEPTDDERTDDGACCGPATGTAADADATGKSGPGAPQNADDGTTGDGAVKRWRPDEGVLETKLPADLRAALGGFVGTESVDTLGEWAAVVRRHTDGDAMPIDDLCHSPVPTGHWGELDGERYDFRCFYDAVVLAALADEPVDIHTESADGTVIEARAVGAEDLLVMPATAVFSFGIAADPPGDGEPSVADFYAAGCPYVKAFPDREAYERWAETVPAHTVAMPLAGATELAAALVD